MMLNVCEMCGENQKGLDEHHALPRFLGGTEKDIVKVCKSCHNKADGYFMKLLLNPFGENDYGTWDSDPQKRREHYRMYYRKYNGEWHRKYYQKNRERIIERSRKWNQQHQEQRKEYIRRYYQKHKNDQ